MADGKIYITISDTRGGSGSGVDGQSIGQQVSVSGNGSNSSSKESMIKQVSRYQFFEFMKNEARQIVAQGISSIGNFTGNYEAQSNIQTGLRHLSIVGNIVNAYAQGNVLGAIAATFGPLGNDVFNMINQRQEYKKINYDIDMLRNRSGLNSLNDGSRGTEN